MSTDMKDGVDAYFLELLNRIVTVIIFSSLTHQASAAITESDCNA